MNPGSVGLQAYEACHPFPHVMQTNSPEARYAIIQRTGTKWLVDLRQVPYDHASAADLARHRGRLDWEAAVRVGRMA
ncbi:hypothetical protein [Castellaniella sp.]|uniref:hypothetical protein n=1 Tax=Castellaniella sp. TaxID=1955812 RepID=UPI002B0028BD|nr:hypothetical protein [Castellaniella sp.]